MFFLEERGSDRNSSSYAKLTREPRDLGTSIRSFSRFGLKGTLKASAITLPFRLSFHLNALVWETEQHLGPGDTPYVANNASCADRR